MGIGIAAAGGLVLFYAGALAAHVRARELGTMYFPGLFFALAVGSFVLEIR